MGGIMSKPKPPPVPKPQPLPAYEPPPAPEPPPAIPDPDENAAALEAKKKAALKAKKSGYASTFLSSDEEDKLG